MTPDHDEGLRVERVLVTHTTGHEPPSDEELSIQAVFRSLVEDEERSRQICGDVASAIEVQRNCLVLTQWTEHLESLSGELQRLGIEAIVMRGGMGKKARASASAEMQAQASAGGLALLATGSFLGEGFDLPQLDTLFLAFPLAFKGRIVQYVGRVLRPMSGKSRVEVHDYVDINVPVLARMQAKRLPAYRLTGFSDRQDGAKPAQGEGEGVARAPSVGRRGIRARVVHAFAHPFSLIGWTRAPTLDGCTAMTRDDGTGAHPLDRAARSLKVATRVRIPLG